MCVEQEKSLFNFTHNSEVQVRIDSYREKLEKKRYKLNQVDRVMYERRLGSLTNGIVKIKVGVPTVTEYKILQLKLDDAIGAVRKAFKYGIVLGGGRALLNVSTQMSNMCWITEALRKPSEVICNNAGVDTNWRASAERNVGMDVTKNKLVDLRAAGILDSYLSIDEALKNASSIACAYLRTNTLMQKETTNK